MRKVKVKVNKENLDKVNDNKTLKIIMIIIISVIIIFLLLNLKKFGIINLKDEQIDYYNYIDLPYEKNTSITQYKNEILVFSENKLSTINSKGRITWQKELNNMLEPLISVENNYILIADKNSNSYIVYKNKKEIIKNEIVGNIKQIDINKYGNVAIIYSGEGYKSILEVFNSDSKSVYKKPLKSDIVNNLIYADMKNIYFTDIEISGTIINTYLNKIDIKDKEQKIKNIHTENKNIIHNLEIYRDILYLQLTDNIKTIYTNRDKTTSVSGLDTKQVVFVDNDEFYYSYVYKNDTNVSKDILEVYTINNKKVAKINLEISPKIFNMKDGLICIASDKKIVIYNYLGKIVKQYDSKANITDIKLFNKGKSLLIKIANKIYVETL